jgi:hypothetical protein
VVALRRLGDVLLTTPLIRSVGRAWTDATIDALVFAGTAGILVRKGATPAFPGQRGFVGGSMGDEGRLPDRRRRRRVADGLPPAHHGLQAHRGTVKILHTLRPFLVLMAGNDVRDPYKD